MREKQYGWKGWKMSILHFLFALAVFFFLGNQNLLLAANGYFLHGVGAVNDAMGGTAIAGNSQDLVGSLYRNPANGDGILTYVDVDDHKFAFGIGFQGGVRYQATDKLGVGFTITSPTWFEKFEWDVKDEAGAKREISFRLNRPPVYRSGHYLSIVSRYPAAF